VNRRLFHAFFHKKKKNLFILSGIPGRNALTGLAELGEIVATRRILPLAAMEKLLKHAGADRVSEDAKESLREVLEEYATELGKRANEFAAHANRKTIKGSDIVLAKKNE
jgi:histone H3/H4